MNTLPITQETINDLANTKEFSKKVIDESAKEKYISLGELSAKEKLDIATKITAVELYCKSFKECIKKDITKDDVELTGNILGASISYGAVSTKYDYKPDKEWNSIKACLDARQEVLKTQRKLYEAHVKGGGTESEFIGNVETTGEPTPVIPKNQSLGVSIELAK